MLTFLHVTHFRAASAIFVLVKWNTNFVNLIWWSILQVANYCRERIHLALTEEVGITKDDLSDETVGRNQQLRWEKVFTNCFMKVDDEIGGKVSKGMSESDGDASDAFEPVAPETVGSTAVVAVVCSSHIIVANCGDSRAVLCRGKEAIALSVDHKVRSFCPTIFMLLRIEALLFLI